MNLKQSLLQSWNTKQDKRVEFLIWAIWWNIDSLLDKKWNIDCSKIDKAIINNSFNLSQEVLALVKVNITKVRTIYAIQNQISYEIERCESFEQKVDVLRTLSKSLNINSMILYKVIINAESLEKALKVISKYWKWVELDLPLLNILFKLSTSLEEKEEILEKFWKWKQIDIYMLNMMLAHAQDLESLWEISQKYWELIWNKFNAVTLMILLKLILKTQEGLERKQSFFHTLELINNLQDDFNDLDKISFWRIIIGSKINYNSILKFIRDKKIEKLYYLLPERKV